MKPEQTKVDPARRGAKSKPLIGAVKPRIHSPLLKGASKIQEVADLAEKIGMPLLPWQHFVLEDMLKVDKDDMFQSQDLIMLSSSTIRKDSFSSYAYIGWFVPI
jgi:hypothetical protein